MTSARDTTLRNGGRKMVAVSWQFPHCVEKRTPCEISNLSDFIQKVENHYFLCPYSIQRWKTTNMRLTVQQKNKAQGRAEHRTCYLGTAYA